MSNEFNRTARMQEGIALGKSNFEENRKQERIKQKHKENVIKDEQKKEERRQLAEKMHLENRLSANVDEIMTIIRVCEAIASKKRREEKNKQEKIKQTREKYAIKVEQRNEERRWLAEEIKEGNHLSASVDEIMTIITNCEILESKKRREEKNKRIEKATKKKKVAKKIVAGALLAVLAAGGACASGLPSYLDGKRQIAEQFYSATTSYGVHDSSEGFKILHNGKISTNNDEFLEMTNEMARLGQKAGMTDEEIYIGLECKISPVAAFQTMGYKMDLSSEWSICTQKANEKTI